MAGGPCKEGIEDIKGGKLMDNKKELMVNWGFCVVEGLLQ